MNFTAKEDYGLRAVLDLAARGSAEPVQTREIAHRQHIPEQFLEQLLAALRRAEVVRSTRGAGGGYTLAAPADRISVGQVLCALSGPLVPPDLIAGDTAKPERTTPESAVVCDLWAAFRDALRGVADRTTLQDLLDQRAGDERNQGYMMHI